MRTKTARNRRAPPTSSSAPRVVAFPIRSAATQTMTAAIRRTKRDASTSRATPSNSLAITVDVSRPPGNAIPKTIVAMAVTKEV